MSHPTWLEEGGRCSKNVVRPLVVGAMVGCIVLSWVQVVRLFSPTWNAAYFFVACVLATSEAYYSYRLVRAKSLYQTDAWKFRLTELATLFVVLKIGSYLGDPWPAVWADVRAWPSEPFAILDPETATAFVLAFLSWLVSTQTFRDLERLDDPNAFHTGETPAQDSLSRRFFWGGGVLLVVAGVTRVGIAQLLELDRPSVPGLVLNVLAYFVLGVIMLGQVRFDTLRKSWRDEKVEIAAGLAGRWIRYSLVFVVLAGLLAVLLPTGYTVSFLDVIRHGVHLFVEILTVIAGLIVFVLSVPVWLLSLLFKGQKTPPLDSPSLSIQPLVSEQTSVGPAWLRILRTIVFWVVAVVVVVYVVRGYLRDHPEIWQALRSFGPFRVLYRLWQTLWRRRDGRRVHHARAGAPRDVDKRQVVRGPGVVARLLGMRGQSPRERVMYYYLNVLRRARRKGFPRQPTQTPGEYRCVLDSNLTEAQSEMDLLTRAFVEARYSRHVISAQQAARAREGWQGVKTALRALRARPRARGRLSRESRDRGSD